MHQLIDSYLNFLAVEKGASLHTLDAYGRDLGRYAQFMSKKGISAAQIKPDGIISFLGELKQQGLSSRSLNRVLAAMRGFHKFLLREKAVQEDPAAHIELAKTWLHLPDTLSRDEMERLLNAPDFRASIDCNSALTAALIAIEGRLTRATPNFFKSLIENAWRL